MPRVLSVFAETFPLHSPFRISRGTKTAAEVVTVMISEDGVIGRGEGVPYPRYGESVDSAIAVIEGLRSAIERGADRHEIMQSMPAGSARNAVDCALWDLELRQGGGDVAAALDLPVPLAPIVTAMTVGLDTAENMARAAAALAAAPLLKVKVDRRDPASLMRAVRAAAPKARMIVDPNESWTIDEVRDLQQLMIELKIDLLEQPLPADADCDLVGFRSAIPIAADEAVHVATDLDALPDGYGVVNIKLDKTGGLTAALELAAAARQRGLGVMTGCMICSSLSIAPAWAVAAKSDFVDLDGPLWLAEDRSGGVRGANGLLSPPQPGFWGGI
ncbi:N-acetyl-D-Glu racemase DgcA [Sphingopyxis solisilvae]|uniref:N-acetyl-D-Glu racemase DgcA n=1 Tax=Sphingopyxis solisilvae TaxID=1886788 RepID=UPI001892D1D0|nr:N-acetyl-D-Glu racemase DgcA [Sphingopyxis solisilvae]